MFLKRPTKTPYAVQFNLNACGPAVLEMVYRYNGLKNISQEKLYSEYQGLEPHGSGNYRMTTDNLVSDARKKGLNSFWARANYESSDDVKNLLETLTKQLRIPVIVCQKLSDQYPQIGHFRVVLSIDKDNISLHDPSPDIGGASQKWPIQKFIDFWKPTGQNVTGGIFIVIKK
ncbi:hypothetical protein C4587_02685 [Candidatus Parcubacteria bacterium]|nr:MAG: hypothetical protein C4587_02685 [Candidatus Parcubacteria bacterium]